MQKQSYFRDKISQIKAMETRALALAEARSTQPVVAQFVKASEADHPKLRYVAPWIQGVFVRLARIAGV